MNAVDSYLHLVIQSRGTCAVCSRPSITIVELNRYHPQNAVDSQTRVPVSTKAMLEVKRLDCTLDDADSWSSLGTVRTQLKCTSGSLRNGTGPVLAAFHGSL